MDTIRHDIVTEMFKPRRKTFKRRKVKCIRRFETLQADLMVMETFKDLNDGYSYILLVIDIFSKFIWVRKLKNKRADETAKAFKSILDDIPHKKDIKHVWVDEGSEFKGQFKDLLKREGINVYNTFSGMKAMIAERAIREFKNRLWKRFALHALNKTDKTMYRWIDIIQEIAQEYNNTPHSTLKGITPAKVGLKEEKYLQKHVYSHPKIRRIPKFQIGDTVRISRGDKNIFRKGYESVYSAELFTITELHQTDPITYTLKNHRNEKLKGKVYEPELVKVRHPDVWLIERVLQKRGNKIKVKWFGLKGEDAEGWIDVSSLV